MSLDPAESLAASVSGQVRQMVEAAERSAAELRGEAEAERDQILQAAHREASEHLERVKEAVAAMLERTEALESELAGLMENVRASASRIAQELEGFDEEEARALRSPSLPSSSHPVDEEGARLTALNLALGGAAREETERYLADHFAVEDLDRLLDDVYAHAGQ